MQTRSWRLYNILTYLSMLLALMQLADIAYMISSALQRGGKHIGFLAAVFTIIPASQMFFHLKSLRLLQHYQANQLAPNPRYKRWHLFWGMLVTVCLILFVWISSQSADVIIHQKEHTTFRLWHINLFVIGVSTIVTNSYCIVTTWVCYIYLKELQTKQENDFLEKLGSQDV